MTRKLALPLLLATGLVAGCGSDNKSDTSSAPSQTSAPASTTAPSSASASSNDITEDSTEFKFSNENISAKAGKVKITLDNKGQTTHELVLLKTDTAPDKLPVQGQGVSEKDSVGEISETDAGKSASHTFDLKPGHYVFVCNIPGHYMDGMRGELTVN